MLNLTIKAGEYFTIGDDIVVTITGGTMNNYRVMIDAPRKYNIVRGEVARRNAKTEQDRERLKSFYPEEQLPREQVMRLIAKQKLEKSKAQRGNFY